MLQSRSGLRRSSTLSPTVVPSKRSPHPRTKVRQQVSLVCLPVLNPVPGYVSSPHAPPYKTLSPCTSSTIIPAAGPLLYPFFRLQPAPPMLCLKWSTGLRNRDNICAGFGGLKEAAGERGHIHTSVPTFSDPYNFFCEHPFAPYCSPPPTLAALLSLSRPQLSLCPSLHPRAWHSGPQ